MGFDLIFVHGTWAKNSEFGERETFFVRTIMNTLGAQATHMRFSWSGRNTVTAREIATQDFQVFLKKLPPKSEGQRRIAICHSHGGSVVMAALNDQECSSLIDGLVCIGTPFIHVYRLAEVEPSRLPPLSLGYATLACVAWMAMGLFVVFTGLVHNAGTIFQAVSSYIVTHWLLILVLCIAAVPLWFLGMAIYTIAYIAVKLGQGRDPFDVFSAAEEAKWATLRPPTDPAWKLKERCELPKSEPVPTLLLRVPSDETYGALNASKMISYIVMKMYFGLMDAISAPGRLLSSIPGVRYFVQLLNSALLNMVRSLVSFPLVLVAGAALILFGKEFVSSAGQVLVSAESAPGGEWRLRVIQPIDRAEEILEAQDEIDGWSGEAEARIEKTWAESVRGILHSRGYTDPRAIKAITDWIEDMPAAKPFKFVSNAAKRRAQEAEIAKNIADFS
jgi:hypothetical protein